MRNTKSTAKETTTSGWTIEHNVPIPTIHAESRYPWSKMLVGDSVVVKGEKNVQMAAANAAMKFAKDRDWQFVTRAIDGGRRIWRTK